MHIVQHRCPTCQQPTNFALKKIEVADHSEEGTPTTRAMSGVICVNCNTVLSFLADEVAPSSKATPADSVRMKVASLEHRLNEARGQLQQIENEKSLGPRNRITPL